MRDFRFLTTRNSLLKAPFRNQRCQRQHKREWKTFILTSANAKQRPVLLSLVPTADSTSAEMSITFFSWFIKYLFFELDFFPWLPFTFSCNTFQLTTSGSLVSLGGNFKIGLKFFRQNYISDDLDFGSEPNLDRNDPIV